MDDAIRLPGLIPVIGGQLRYPRTLMAGLILPGALLALQLGRVQHIGQGAAADVLAAPPGASPWPPRGPPSHG